MTLKIKEFAVNKKETLLLVLLSILALYLFFRFGVSVYNGKGFVPTDYSVFHRAIERFLNKAIVYEPLDSSPFKYTPSFLAVFYGLYFKNKTLGWLLWSAFSIFIFVTGTFFFFKRILKLYNVKTSHFLTALVLSFICAWHGILEHLSYGQSDFFIISCAIFAFLLTTKKSSESHFLEPRFILPALFAVLALIVKPAAILIFSGLFWNGFGILSFYGFFWFVIIQIGTSFFLEYHGYPYTLGDLYMQWISSLKEQPAVLFSGNLNQSFGAIFSRLCNHADWSEVFCKKIFFAAFFVTLISFVVGFNKIVRKKTIKENDKLNLHLFLAGLGIFLVANPLSWRWTTFSWLYLFFYSLIIFPKKLRFRIILGSCFILVLFLQKFFATIIGIKEIDILSYYGFYGLVSFLLTVFVFLSWPYQTVSKKE